MSGDVGAEVAAALAERLHELRGHNRSPYRVPASICAPCDQDADQLARALAPLIDVRVEAAKAEAFALRERVEDALSLAEQRQHPMDPRAATIYVAEVRAALDPVARRDGGAGMMGGMDTLVEFLLAQIAVDEQRAPRRRGDYYERPCPACDRPVTGIGTPWDDEAARALHQDDPFNNGCALTREQFEVLMPDQGPTPEGARVLAKCAAERRVVQMCEAIAPGRVPAAGLAVQVLKELAYPYAGRPGYLEEWRP